MEKRDFFGISMICVLFFASPASSQSGPPGGGGNLDAACANAMQAPEPMRVSLCANISAQVSSGAPEGITLSCTWTGSACVASIVVSDSVKDPGTLSTDLRSACAKGNTYEDLCTNISSSISGSGSSPAGVTVACVWQHPGASNACSPRITLDTSTITGPMVGNGIIKSMEFRQGGIVKTSVKVLSDPFEPYVIHTVIDGTNLPGGRDSDTWMTVTATKDITPQTFDFNSINPAAMAEAEKNRLKAQFSSANLDIGQGIGPDFSALKALQTFNWSMTLPYDTGKEFAGAAQCNGTFNETLDQCMSGASQAPWLKLTECTSANCASGTYRMDFPSQGYLTIYDADPVPLYETSTTTTTLGSTTTTSGSTTTTTSACTLAGDNPPCGTVTLSEVVAFINKWSSGLAALSDVIKLITAWAG